MLTNSVSRGLLCLTVFCLLVVPLRAVATDDELSLMVVICNGNELHKAACELAWYDENDNLKDTMVEYTDYGEVLFEFSGLESGDYVVIEVTPEQGDPYDSSHRLNWIGDTNSQDNWSPPPPPPPGGGGSGSLVPCYDSCAEDDCTIYPRYE